MPLLQDHQLRYVPVACFVCGIVGVVGTFVLSAVLPHWWFGMNIPQVSITGYDPLPCYLLFCFGLSATGFFAGWTGVVLYDWVEKVRTACRRAGSIWSRTLGLVGAGASATDENLEAGSRNTAGAPERSRSSAARRSWRGCTAGLLDHFS